jgi:hypothetical protein
VYFRRQAASFGTVAVGSMSRQELELCNATERRVTVLISDAALPFVLIHSEVHMQPRSFVRVPVRFVPVAGPREYRSKLLAHTDDGAFVTEITLDGASY